MAVPRGGHAGHVARRLGDIVKLPLLQREPKERVAEIWAGHHQTRPDAIGRSLEAAHFELLQSRAAPAPMFIFPVHRSGGHFVLLSQFQQQRHFLLTYLEDYKRHGGHARPNLSLTFHDDLARDKGIVLLRADLESLLTKREAEHLVDQLLQTYLVATRYSAAQGPLAFNTAPQTFDHDAYVKSYPQLPS